MKNIVEILVRGLVLIGVLAVLAVFFHSCLTEDHRHTEEMKRLNLVKSGCTEQVVE